MFDAALTPSEIAFPFLFGFRLPHQCAYCSFDADFGWQSSISTIGGILLNAMLNTGFEYWKMRRVRSPPSLMMPPSAIQSVSFQISISLLSFFIFTLLFCAARGPRGGAVGFQRRRQARGHAHGDPGERGARRRHSDCGQGRSRGGRRRHLLLDRCAFCSERACRF